MLICDKRRPRTRGDTNIRPPRGPNKTTPRPPARAYGAPWQGLAPQTPRAAPWRAFARRAPAASVTQPEGSGHGCARWRGWATRQRCPRSTPSPSPSPLCFQFSKVGRADARRGIRGRAPVVGRRWATRPRRWAVRVQPQAVPAVHGLGEVVHGRPGPGQSLRSLE